MTVGHTRKLSGLSSALLSAAVSLDDCALKPSNNNNNKGSTTAVLAASQKPELVRAQQQSRLGLVRTQREHVVKRSSSSCRIRSRLLNSLGIEKDQAAAASMAAARAHEPSPLVLRGQNDALDMVLKADHGKPDKSLEKLKKQSANKDEIIAASPGDRVVSYFPTLSRSVDEQGAERGVFFDTAVKVHLIPARSDYSQRMQTALWTPQEELQQNAARNQFEFAAEEWDYTKVVDDEDMVVYGGERIHPVHFMQEDELKEYFRGIVEQQKQQQEKQQEQQ